MEACQIPHDADNASSARFAIDARTSFSKEEVIEHLDKKDETGALIVEMQLSMIRYLAKSH